MKKVITFGVFDYFHYGHMKLFERAKSFGNYLIVAVQSSDVILKYKPNAEILYSTQQRIELVRALRLVDEVIVYRDVDEDIRCVDFDVFVRGEDQNHKGFLRATEYAAVNGKEVVVLPRTKGISSSQIKSQINEQQR